MSVDEIRAYLATQDGDRSAIRARLRHVRTWLSDYRRTARSFDDELVRDEWRRATAADYAFAKKARGDLRKRLWRSLWPA